MAVPQRTDTSPPRVVIYTRAGCHLCDEALALLRQFGIHPEVVDIDAHAELQSRYNTCVPVVTWNGRERFRGRVSAVLLRRLLRRGSG